MSQQPFRSGFVSLIGLPNAGKSTLLNQLSGLHLAITSPKPQTTRHIIQAIIDQPGSQIIFLDTPGYHQPKSRLDRYMAGRITTAVMDSDIVLMITDAAAASEARRNELPKQEQQLLASVRQMDKPVILALNKVDKMPKENLLPVIERYNKAYPFMSIIPLSARSGDGMNIILEEITRRLPEGPRYFPADSITDQTERSLAGELIREQILLLTHEEIPHGVAVSIELFEEEGSPERERVFIHAVIYCDRESHKKIIIGRQGSMLKRIGTAARINIESMLECPCYLELFVKVREDWRNKSDILKNLGFETRK